MSQESFCISSSGRLVATETLRSFTQSHIASALLTRCLDAPFANRRWNNESNSRDVTLVLRARIAVTYSPQTAEGAEMKRVTQDGPPAPRQ